MISLIALFIGKSWQKIHIYDWLDKGQEVIVKVEIYSDKSIVRINDCRRQKIYYNL